MFLKFGDELDYFCIRNLDNITDPDFARDNKDRFRLMAEREHFYRDDTDEHHVRNLTSLKIRKLPRPASHKGVFDHEHSNGEAKLLHEHHYPTPRKSYRKCLEILTIGRDENWRALEPPNSMRN